MKSTLKEAIIQFKHLKSFEMIDSMQFYCLANVASTEPSNKQLSHYSYFKLILSLK